MQILKMLASSMKTLNQSFKYNFFFAARTKSATSSIAVLLTKSSSRLALTSMRGVGLSVLLLFQCAGEKLKHMSPFDETGPSVRGLSHINKMSQPFYSLWTVSKRFPLTLTLSSKVVLCSSPKLS